MEIREYKINPTKTYKTPENAAKAAQAIADKLYQDATGVLHFFVMQHTDGRFFPVFFGQKAIQAGVHFHFNVVA